VVILAIIHPNHVFCNVLLHFIHLKMPLHISALNVVGLVSPAYQITNA
jgi:hypothetical protein